MKKIAICIPLKGSVHYSFLVNLVTQVLKNSKLYELSLVYSTRMPLDAARNEILNIALESKPDYLWWIDSDIVLPENKNVLQELIEADKDIVSALYFKKEFPYLPVFTILKDNRPYITKPLKINQILKVDAVGLGCLLVKRKVFEKLKNPVFEFKLNNSMDAMGEDVNFCLKAKKAGFDIYLNSNIIVGHIGSTIVDDKIYFKYME